MASSDIYIYINIICARHVGHQESVQGFGFGVEADGVDLTLLTVCPNMSLYSLLWGYCGGYKGFLWG